ncbi:MAG: phosphoenolpyruvate synthase, partial [Candidatus Gracilibacteria bacterium]|nr:phosphoenolpyruvate synthase [Candidatus Gracilibacteria bacterium]
MEGFVFDLVDVDKSYAEVVGGKGANLGELTKAGFNVPQGFCVTVQAYKYMVLKYKKYSNLIEKLDLLDVNELKKLEKVSEQIREYILNLKFPIDLENVILDAWDKNGKNKSYAVRSSATSEDLPDASFAGQQESFLNIKGSDQLLESIKKCFASLFTFRAVVYRKKNKFSNDKVFLSVVVQEMIFSEISGIMFTADPVTGNRKVVSINASFGLGEALVSGLVQPDLYIVNGSRITKRVISKKDVKVTSVREGGTEQSDIKPAKQAVQALNDKQILELSKLGKDIENHYKTEQDIEWCFKDNKFFIVQSRPITSLYPLPENMIKGFHFFLSIGHVQMMTEAIKPLGISVFLTFSRYVEDYFKMKNPLLYDSGSHLYVDLMNLLDYKIFKSTLPFILQNVDENSSKILVNFMKNREFKKLKRKRLSFKRIIVLLKFLYQELKLLFFGDLDNIYDDLDKVISNKLYVLRNELQEVVLKDKVKKIKSTILSLPKYIAETNILKYMPLAIGTYKILGNLSQKWLGDTNEIDAIGKAPEGNVTTEMGLVIGDMADIVSKNDILREYLENGEYDNFWKDIERTKGGKEFSELFHQFLKKYGMRCSGEIDITHPRWKDQPMQVVSLILNSAKNTDLNQHRDDFVLAKAEGLDASNRFIERLKSTRFGFLKAFFVKRLIYVYRSTIGVREHPKFFLVNIFDIIRDAILEEGNMLVNEKVIENIEDIYYFTFDEIEYILETKEVDNTLLKNRKYRFERNSRLKPPRVFTGDGEVLYAKPNLNIPEGAISGTAASSGIIEGRARVILNLEDADLENGDIIVTTYTDPAWTTLFGIASAVVTEVGGLLTHGAVVAREYGIPAVVGVDDVTNFIQDGDKIRVNG